MPETLEEIQQEAYVRGQQMRQWHHQQQRVVTGEALLILAADFAHVSLFQASHHLGVLTAHERAGICEQAFLEGYRSPLA